MKNSEKILSRKVDLFNLGITDMLAQQAGLSLNRGGKPLALDPKKISDEKKREAALKKYASLDEIPVEMEVGDRTKNLLGISQLFRELRILLLSLDRIYDLKRSTSEEILLETKTIEFNNYISEDVFLKSDNVVKKYVGSQARIHTLLEIILDLDSNTKSKYQEVISQIKTWQEVLDITLSNAIGKEEHKNLLDEVKIDDLEKERLRKLVSGERSSKNKQELQERVIKTLLGSISIEKQTKITEDLSNEFLQMALSINEMRVISRVEAAGIDLLDVKKQVQKLQETYKNIPLGLNVTERDNLINDLNEELEKLIILIVNIIAEIFPDRLNSISHLSAILVNSDTNCVGKTNITLVISKYLGLKAISSEVLTMHDGEKTPHAIAIVSLFEGKKLVVDANWSSYNYLKNKQEKEEVITLIKEKNPHRKSEWFERTYNFWLRFYKENQSFISEKSERFIYSISKEKGEKHKYPFTRILEDGKKIILFASIPHPHLLIIPDKDENIISFSSYYNFAHALKNLFDNYPLAIEFLEKSLEISPYSSSANNNLANLFKSHLKRYDLARDLYKLAIKTDSKWIFHKNLANMLYDYSQDYFETVENYEEALKIDQEREYNIDIHFRLSELYKNFSEELGLSNQVAVELFESHYNKYLELETLSNFT